jgi:hypothetical protein
LPTVISLASNGVVSGTLSSPPGTETTYTFSVVATDAQNQESTRQFTVTTTSGEGVLFANNVLLIHADGTNNKNNHTFLDSSNNNFTITRNGNATQGSFSPFSQTGWSNFFDGTGDYLSVADNAALKMGTGNFTIECWIYHTAGSRDQYIISKGDSGTNGYTLWVPAAGNLRFTYGTSTSITTTNSVPANSWVHVCAVREGTGTNQFKLYINGIASANATVTYDFNETNSLFIGDGRTGAGTSEFLGYISNLRVVKGTAVYTSNFTPSTTPLTNIANTSLLTLQSNRFIDNSNNNFTITRNGDTSIQAFSPFAPTAAYSTADVGGSVYIPSGTNGLSIASVPSIGTGNFTVEGWFWPTDDVIRSEFDSAWALNAGNFNGVDSAQGAVRSTAIIFRSNGTTDFSASVSIANRWSHIAWVRNGTTVTIYLNGVSVATGTYSNSIAGGTAYISRPDTNQFRFNGYISGFRVVNSAVYTGAFTPPTSPPTNIANTSLLLNFTNAGIFDQTAKNILETVGDAKVSTTQYKYGTASMYFDGTGDSLLIPASKNFAFGTGDFTVEFWMRSTDTDFNLIGLTTAAAGNWNLVMAGSSLYWQSQHATTNLYNRSGTSILDGNWHHIAITRASGTNRMFFDGVLQGSVTSDSTNYTAPNNMQIGTSSTYGDFSGYLDDLRITKGYARYTSNFTPPAAAFKDK